VKGTSRNFAKV